LTQANLQKAKPLLISQRRRTLAQGCAAPCFYDKVNIDIRLPALRVSFAYKFIGEKAMQDQDSTGAQPAEVVEG
jgi:hypothetical protein